MIVKTPPVLYKVFVGNVGKVKEIKQLFDDVKNKAKVVVVDVEPEKILAAQIIEIQKQTEGQFQEVDKIFDMQDSQNDINAPEVLVGDNAKLKAEIAQIKQQEKERI